nr:RDD family protein [Marinicella sp. W31]MDC2877833.1 RDD family protein [Marinicella sp. W31]
MLYPVLYFIVAVFYFGFTMGGFAQASLGMRTMGLRIVRTDGLRMDFLTAAVHLALFWLFNSILTPLVLLVGLFTDRKRLLHDFLVGAVIVREEAI